MRRLVALVAVLAASACFGGCSRVDVALPAAAVAGPRLSVEDAWVHPTTGEDDPSTTAAYLTIVNPGDADVKLTSAECADAGVLQLHEMVMQAGKMVMQETKEGIAVPAGGHAHLTPGGFHIMMMMLNRKLAVGDRVTLTLHFSDGGQLTVVAPVKELVQGADHSHPPTATATASS